MIRLTTLTKVLTEAAEKKLEGFEAKLLSGNEEPEEDLWSRMGIQKPEDSEPEDELNKTLSEISFEESDFEYKVGHCLVNPLRIDLILSIEDDSIEGSEVFMESGKSFTVEEKPEAIEALMLQAV